MIAHHRVGGDIDGEHRSELLQTLDDPAAPVLEVAAGVVIHAAKIGAPGVQARWVSRSSVLPEFVAYIRPSRFSGWTAGCSCPKA